jgi:hypothetical protein
VTILFLSTARKKTVLAAKSARAHVRVGEKWFVDRKRKTTDQTDQSDRVTAPAAGIKGGTEMAKLRMLSPLVPVLDTRTVRPLR